MPAELPSRSLSEEVRNEVGRVRGGKRCRKKIPSKMVEMKPSPSVTVCVSGVNILTRQRRLSESLEKLRPAACCLVSERHTQNVTRKRGEKASKKLSVTTSSRRFRENNYQGQKGLAHQGEERKCSRKGNGVVFGCNKQPQHKQRLRSVGSVLVREEFYTALLLS